ncbi:MAG TPA: hypothetical protein VGM05_22010 [Planctomycetaceae bacterium]
MNLNCEKTPRNQASRLVQMAMEQCTCPDCRCEVHGIESPHFDSAELPNSRRPALEWYSHRAEWIEENSVAIAARLARCVLPEQFTAFGRWLKESIDAYHVRRECDEDRKTRIERSG